MPKLLSDVMSQNHYFRMWCPNYFRMWCPTTITFGCDVPTTFICDVPTTFGCDVPTPFICDVPKISIFGKFYFQMWGEDVTSHMISIFGEILLSDVMCGNFPHFRMWCVHFLATFGCDVRLLTTSEAPRTNDRSKEICDWMVISVGTSHREKKFWKVLLDFFGHHICKNLRWDITFGKIYVMS